MTVAIDESGYHVMNIRGPDDYQAESLVAQDSSGLDTTSDTDIDESTTSSRTIIFGAEIMD